MTALVRVRLSDGRLHTVSASSGAADFSLEQLYTEVSAVEPLSALAGKWMLASIYPHRLLYDNNKQHSQLQFCRALGILGTTLAVVPVLENTSSIPTNVFVSQNVKEGSAVEINHAFDLNDGSLKNINENEGNAEAGANMGANSTIDNDVDDIMNQYDDEYTARSVKSERQAAAVEYRLHQQQRRLKEDQKRCQPTCRVAPSLITIAMLSLIPLLISPSTRRSQILPLRFLPARLADRLLALLVQLRALNEFTARRISLCGIETIDFAFNQAISPSIVRTLGHSPVGASLTAKYLNLSGCSTVSRGNNETIDKNYTNLQGGLLLTSIIDGGFMWLNTLDLTSCYLTDDAFHAWQQLDPLCSGSQSAATFFPNLEDLNLSSNHITIMTLNALARLLAPHERLRILNVAYCPKVYADKVLDAIAPLSKSIVSANVVGCVHVAPMYHHHSSLSSTTTCDGQTPNQCFLHNHHSLPLGAPGRLDSNGASELITFTRLETFDASGSAITNNYIPLLVIRAPNLTTLNLYNTTVSTISIPFIGRLLHLERFMYSPSPAISQEVLAWLNHLSLVTLILTGSIEEPVNLTFALRSSFDLPPAPMGLSFLSSPNMDNSPIYRVSLSHPYFQETNNVISCSTIPQLLNSLTNLTIVSPLLPPSETIALKSFISITHLTLTHTSFSDRSMAHILHLPLVSLDLSYTMVTAVGICVLAQLIDPLTMQPFSSTSPSSSTISSFNSFSTCRNTLTILLLNYIDCAPRYSYIIVRRCPQLSTLSMTKLIANNLSNAVNTPISSCIDANVNNGTRYTPLRVLDACICAILNHIEGSSLSIFQSCSSSSSSSSSQSSPHFNRQETVDYQATLEQQLFTPMIVDASSQLMHVLQQSMDDEESIRVLTQWMTEKNVKFSVSHTKNNNSIVLGPRAVVVGENDIHAFGGMGRGWRRGRGRGRGAFHGVGYILGAISQPLPRQVQQQVSIGRGHRGRQRERRNRRFPGRGRSIVDSIIEL